MGPEHYPDRGGEPTSEFRPIPPQERPGRQFEHEQQFEHGQQAPPGPSFHHGQYYSPHPGQGPQKPGMSTGTAVALTLMAVVIVALLGAVAYFLVPGLTGSSAAPAVTSTVAVTSTAPGQPESAPAEEPPVRPATAAARPAGAYECTNSGGGQLSRAAVGSSATSCEFAASVRAAYLAAGGGGAAMVVDAYSPVTGTVYTMSCSAGPPVTCTGGNNAVVYLY